jgi:hypothetical protein
MRSKDQKKYFEQLKRYEKKFDEKECYDYKMFLQRHKDEEELDKLSLEKLKELFIKYHVNREKKNYDDFFKKSSDCE